MTTRVLRIIDRLNVGGPARHCFYLLDLDSDNFETLITTGNVSEGEDSFEHLFPGNKIIKFDRMKRAIHLADDLFMIWKLFLLMLKFKPHVIHTHKSKGGFWGRIAAAMYRTVAFFGGQAFPGKIKVFHTFHGHTFYGYFKPLMTKLIIFIERTLGHFFTSKVLTLSDLLFRDITETYKITTPDRCKIVRLGIDNESLNPENLKQYKNSIKKEFNLPSNAFIIALISRLAEIKNAEMFIDVCSHYMKNFPGNDENTVFFMLVGKGTPAYELKLKKRIQDKDLSERLIMTGNRYDIEKFYADIDLCALTSKNEGTPLSFLEAFATKVPCISTNVGGVSDLFAADNQRGILIDDFSVEKYAREINRIVTGEFNTLPMTEQAYNFVLENHSRKILVHNIKELYLS